MKPPVLFVSAGLLAPKKADSLVSRQHQYLNYGLLGLASILDDAGQPAFVIQGNFEPPEEVVQRLVSQDLLPNPHPLMLSVPSCFALPWARAFCKAVKEVSPELRIVAGGRWVISDEGPWIRSQLPDVDQFVQGMGEGVIESLVKRSAVRFAEASLGGGTNRQLPTLNYSLLEGWDRYHPSLEVSRGCGMGCSFCAEAREPLQALKDPAILASEFNDLREAYGGDDFHLYLESSLFRPSSAWVDSFCSELKKDQIPLAWRTETRVDVLSPQLVSALANTGLRVLDLGLESASPSQLTKMNKATKPEVYLRRASELLEACRAANVWAKINILLYPGETEKSVGETIQWLEEHRDLIKGVSVGPVILFRYGLESEALLREFQELGASPVDFVDLDRQGYAHLNLSKEISHTRAIELSGEISRSFMSDRDYFDLKAFSYLPRGFTWSRFQELGGRAS